MIKISRKLKLAIFSASILLDIATTYSDMGVGHRTCELLMYAGYGLSFFFASKAIYDSAPAMANATTLAINKIAKIGREKFDPTKSEYY